MSSGASAVASLPHGCCVPLVRTLPQDGAADEHVSARGGRGSEATLPEPRAPRAEVRTLQRQAVAESLADVERERGNIAYRNGEFERAEAAYSRAVAADSSLPAAWANRAMARIKTSDPAGAAADASQALQLLAWDESRGPGHASAPLAGKCLLRRSVARTTLGLIRLAIADAAAACAAQPASAQAAAQLQRLVRRREAAVKAEPRRALVPGVVVVGAEAMTASAASAEAEAVSQAERDGPRPDARRSIEHARPDSRPATAAPSASGLRRATPETADAADAAGSQPAQRRNLPAALSAATPSGRPTPAGAQSPSRAPAGAPRAVPPAAEPVMQSAATAPADAASSPGGACGREGDASFSGAASAPSAAPAEAVAAGAERAADAKPARKARLGGFELEAAWAAADSPAKRWKLLTGLGKGGVGACFARSGGSAMDGEFAGQIVQTLAKVVAGGDSAVLAKARRVKRGLLAAPMWSMTFDMLEEADRAALASVERALG